MSKPTESHSSSLTTPADGGLTHLGLVTEAIGWAQTATAATMLLSLLVSATGNGDMWGNRPVVSDLESRFFVAGLVFFVGSLMLALAGRGLAAGSAVAARVYVVGGGLAAIAFTAILGKGASTTSLVLGSIVALAWPAVIALAVWRRPKSTDPLFAYHFPKPPDGGLAGLQTLMILVATIELVAAAGAFWFAAAADDSPLPSVPALVLGFMLVVRAILQIIAAGVTRLQSPKATQRYVVFGLGSAAAFVLVNMIVEWDKQLLIFVLGGAAILASWPYVVRGYVARNIATNTDSPASDLGLMAVGWLLVFFGLREALSYGLGLGQAVSHGLELNLDILLPVVLAFAQLWAGIEVLAISKRMRLSVGLYALCGIVGGILIWRDIVHSSSGFDMVQAGIGLGGLAAASTLALPIASLIVVDRAWRKRAG